MPRTVKHPDERRQELLDIGFELLMQSGTSGLSVKEVVNRANVATGLFYYYFDSKEQFIEEALNGHIVTSLERIQKILQSDSINIMQKADQGLEAFWAHIEHLAPFIQDVTLQTQYHHILMDKLLNQLQPSIQSMIEEGNHEGYFHAEDPALASIFILHGLSGILHSNQEISTEAKEKMKRLVFNTVRSD